MARAREELGDLHRRTFPAESGGNIASVKFLGVFFLQAEDGIRELTVTGVQTCALPIYRARCCDAAAPEHLLWLPRVERGAVLGGRRGPAIHAPAQRLERLRCGAGCIPAREPRRVDRKSVV